MIGSLSRALKDARKKIFIIENKKEQGMTLIEIMIVIAILGGLMAVLIPNLMESQKQANISNTKIGMGTVGTALDLYKVTHKKLPTTDEGLQLLRDKGSLTKGNMKDAWGNEYTYERIGRSYWKLTTLDPDDNIICRSSRDDKYCDDDKEEQEDE